MEDTEETLKLLRHLRSVYRQEQLKVLDTEPFLSEKTISKKELDTLAKLLRQLTIDILPIIEAECNTAYRELVKFHKREAKLDSNEWLSLLTEYIFQEGLRTGVIRLTNTFSKSVERI